MRIRVLAGLMLAAAILCGQGFPPGGVVHDGATNGGIYRDVNGFLHASAAGATGTFCWVTTNGGTPTYSSCAGSASTNVSFLSDATQANTVAIGNFGQVWNAQVTSNGGIAWTFGETAASTGTAAQIVNIQTLPTSTAAPLTVTVRGIVNGIQIDTGGIVRALGTGGVDAAAIITGTLSNNRLAAGAAVANLGFTPLNPANNLSDVTAATARTNLGLGTAAVQNIAAFLQPSNNLSDVGTTATARTNLGVAIGTNVEAWAANLDTWAGKTPPTGTVVGTTDTQTLTNKTLDGVTPTVFGYLDPTSPIQAQINAKLTGTATLFAQKFFGTAAPGSVVGNLPGDSFNDTTNHKIYVCNAPAGTPAPACTTVGIGNWTEADGTGGGGGGTPCTLTALSLQFNSAGAFGCAPDFTVGGTGNHTIAGGAAGIVDLSAMSPTAGFKPPAAAGAAPTTEGVWSFNTTTHQPVWGANGVTHSAASIEGAETLLLKTLTQPTIADFSNATHSHQGTASGGQLNFGVFSTQAPCSFLGNFTAGTATLAEAAAGSGLGCAGGLPIVNSGIFAAISSILNGNTFVGLDTQGTTAYVASPASCPTGTALTDGMVAFFRTTTASTTTASLNWCGLSPGGASIKDYTGTVDPGTTIKATALNIVQYDSALGVWRQQFASGTGLNQLTGDVTAGPGTGSQAATIPAGTVTLAKMANLAANSIMGNNTGSPGVPLALTATQATAFLNLFTNTLQGLVPGGSAGDTTKFLRGDQTWAVPPGGSGATFVRHAAFSNASPITPTCTATGQDDFEIAAITGDVTINAPTGCTAGQNLIFQIPQDSQGGWVVTWNAAFLGVTTSTVGLAAAKRNLVAFYYDGTNWSLTEVIQNE